jgi:fumarate reductase iron-sulfur subunit
MDAITMPPMSTYSFRRKELKSTCISGNGTRGTIADEINKISGCTATFRRVDARRPLNNRPEAFGDRHEYGRARWALLKGTCKVRVLRSDPSKNEKPAYSSYEVPTTQETSVLDALTYIKDNIDGTLAVSYSCKLQRCGSCALRIDGKVSLGCFTPVREGQAIEPLPGFPVVRDLVVDWTPYETRMLELLPPTTEEPVHGHRTATAKERALAESAMTCIKCYSCVAVCPTVDITGPVGFAGPAISVALATYMDVGGASQGLSSSAVEAGLEFCTRCYACNKVCPAGIDVVASIAQLQDLAGEDGGKGELLREMVRGRL